MMLPASQRRLVERALTALFGALDGAVLSDIVDRIAIEHLPRGQVLYKQGEIGSNMHIVLTGRLQVRVHTDSGADRVLAHPELGESVGEMALLTGSPRAATISAVRDATLAALSREVFDAVIAANPAVLSHISRMIIARMSNAQSRSASRVQTRTIAVVPLHATLDAGDFCRRLRLALLRFGSVAHIDGRTMAHRFPAGSSDLDRERYLDESERTHDYVLLEADATAGAWTRKCCGVADRILLVGTSATTPGLTAVERDLFAGAGADRGAVIPELALLHTETHRPSGTRAWLDSRRVGRHYHVSARGNEGFNRLARFMAGRAVALVLAGGGARGFAHLGVIRALVEAGVPIDAVGGTSFGAIAATGPARGFEIEAMLEELRHAFTTERPLDDYTLPVVSLVRGERLDGLLSRYLDMDIEDLWIPYFAVSSNLSQNRVEVHERGSLWRAVRASISLPGILPPVLHQGDLLIDGGVLNNLPVDVMQDRIRGRIIAVDLSVQHEYRLAKQEVPSGFDYLKSRLLPWADPLDAPTMARVIMKTTTLASRREVEIARKAAHLYLNLPLADYDLLDWGKFHQIVDVGYRYAQKALGELLASEPDIAQRRSFLSTNY